MANPAFSLWRSVATKAALIWRFLDCEECAAMIVVSFFWDIFMSLINGLWLFVTNFRKSSGILVDIRGLGL